MAKSGRRSVTTSKSLVRSREEQIKVLVAAGLANDAIWAAMEASNPGIIKEKARRKEMAGKDIPYDADLRTKVGWAIRSVKGLAIKDDEKFNGIREDGEIEAESIGKTAFSNRARFSSGWDIIDYLYGETYYVHCSDHQQGLFKKGDPMLLDTDGQTLIYPRHEGGELIPNYHDLLNQQKKEIGLPYRFMGFWAGAPGVGKTRTAIELCHALNRVGMKSLYCNGELPRADFRSFCGPNVNEELFWVIHGETKAGKPLMIPMSLVEDKVREVKPQVLIVDSVQMIVEWNMGISHQKLALGRMSMLRSDVRCGQPHIVMISQLNKSEDMAGAKILQHLGDYVILVYHREGHKDQFIMEADKMRGAQTRRIILKHTRNGIQTVSSDFAEPTPLYQLKQEPVSEAIEHGVQESKNEEESEEQDA